MVFFVCSLIRMVVIFIAKKENFLNFSVPFPEEKSRALVLYLEENGESLERCMVESIEQLYRKTVPVGIRKYIEATLRRQNPEPEKPPDEGEAGPEGATGL